MSTILERLTKLYSENNKLYLHLLTKEEQEECLKGQAEVLLDAAENAEKRKELHDKEQMKYLPLPKFLTPKQVRKANRKFLKRSVITREEFVKLISQ